MSSLSLSHTIGYTLPPVISSQLGHVERLIPRYAYPRIKPLTLIEGFTMFRDMEI